MKSLLKKILLLLVGSTVPAFGLLPVDPAHLIIVSYGRLAGDPTLNDLEPVLKVFRDTCPYALQVHYLDDPTPEQIRLEKGKYPSNSLVLINAHGIMEDGKFKIGSSPLYDGETVLNAASHLGWGSKIWVGTCHSGGACFKKGACVGTECSKEEEAASDLPVLRKLAPLYCSALGQDSCKLFNETDKDHNGRIDNKELRDFLRTPRRVKAENYALKNDAEIEKTSKACRALKKGKTVPETNLSVSLGGHLGYCDIPRKAGAEEQKAYLNTLGPSLFKNWPNQCDRKELPKNLKLADGSSCTIPTPSEERPVVKKCELSATTQYTVICEWEDDGIEAFPLDNKPFQEAYNHPDPKTFFLEKMECTRSAPSTTRKKTH